MAIVVSLLEPDLESLQSAIERQAPLADVLELRLDRIGNPGEERLRELIKACPKPVIVTVHGREGFGDFEGSIDERLEILRTAARAGAAFVDIDWSLSLELGEVPGFAHRIVSRHELDGTPDDLAALHEAQCAVLYEGDIIKLVTHARCTEDGLRVMRFLRQTGGGLIAFCSGAAGTFTRVLAPILGSPFTYVAPGEVPGARAGQRTAPGQLRVTEFLSLVPPGGLSPETAIFGIVGNPVSHSWSPRLHGMALKAATLDAVYLSFEPEDFDRFLELADDENFRGFSVTAPFKERARALAQAEDHTTEAARAANTLVRDGAGWRAYNTDVPAIRETIERSLSAHEMRAGMTLAAADLRAVVLGAGGAARAAAQALRELGAHFSICARDLERASALATEFGASAVPWGDLAGVAHDLLIHCTPAGSLAQPGELPIATDEIGRGGIVIDAAYRPLRTPLLLAARERDNTVVPGGEWFVRQAIAQFQLFTHQEPDEALMRAAFEHAFGEDER